MGIQETTRKTNSLYQLVLSPGMGTGFRWLEGIHLVLRTRQGIAGMRTKADKISYWAWRFWIIGWSISGGTVRCLRDIYIFKGLLRLPFRSHHPTASVQSARIWYPLLAFPNSLLMLMQSGRGWCNQTLADDMQQTESVQRGNSAWGKSKLLPVTTCITYTTVTQINWLGLYQELFRWLRSNQQHDAKPLGPAYPVRRVSCLPEVMYHRIVSSQCSCGSYRYTIHTSSECKRAMHCCSVESSLVFYPLVIWIGARMVL